MGLVTLLVAAAAAVAVTKLAETKEVSQEMRPRIEEGAGRLEKGISLLSSILTFIREVIKFFLGGKSSKTVKGSHSPPRYTYDHYEYEPYQDPYGPHTGDVW